MKSADEILEYTQLVRERMVDAIMVDGVPVDPKDRATLLATLDGMDRVAIANKRIASQEKISGAEAEAIRLVTAVLDKLPARNPYVAETAVNREALPDIDTIGLDPLVPVEGETEIGVSTETVETFYQKFEDPK